ncbi:MAG: branched-chain amino acid ABC transporter permease [Defluviitaleaceae bacterium]|nr:branched-chain amino acid ABC transporter permease [Defluviitaleaceae bacterium]
MQNILKHNYTKYIVFGIIISLMPTLAGIGLIRSASVIVLGAVIFYGVVAIGLNILLGFSGLISLGTAGFMGLGAYMSAYLTEILGLPFLLSLAISVVVPVIIGSLVGLVSLRVSGMYLAIATLAVSEVFRLMFSEFTDITGGFSGMRASFPSFFGISLSRDTTFIFLVVILVLLMILTDNFVNSSVGRALLTMRVSETAASAMGINLLKYKLMAFALATAYAAIGGVMYVHFIQFSFPTVWTVMLSLQILAAVVIGGIKTIFGPIIGAFVVFGVPELFLNRLPIIGDIPGLAFMFTGVLIIVVILFYPNGLIYLGHDIKRLWLKNRKSQKGGETA